MSAKKSSSAAKTTKKTAARPAATHPSWIEMIKECIAANPDDSRQGVSRPHIKKYVEEQYNLQIGNAQNTQLARAITTGAEKGIFVLPKGPAGKVKLPPKNVRPVDTSASKENKPAKVAAPKPVAKGRPTKAASAKATAVKSTSAKKVAAKTKTVTAAKASAPKRVAEKKPEAARVSKAAAAKAAAAKAPKKILAGKKAAPTKKMAAPSKRGAAKKAVTGTSAPAKAKAAAAKKAPTSRKASASKKVPSKRKLPVGVVKYGPTSCSQEQQRDRFMSTQQHRPSSSRAAYPVFLPLHETLWLQTKWIFRGLFDAFRWDVVIRTASSDPEIRSNIIKSLLLNMLSLTSIYIFDLILQPLVHEQPSWLHRNVGWFYRVLWLLPVVGVSFYLNNSWCNIIAKRTFVLQHGNRATQQQPVTYTGMLTMLATSAYRAVMVLTSVMVSFALGAIPYGGPLISFAFMCWNRKLTCLEYRFIWIARGHSLSTRVRYLEERWPYFFAFGFPSAAICTWGSGLANAALFALLFPAYIIMAMHARPVPHDPFNPLDSSKKNDAVRYPSPLIPIRLPIFAAVIWLNDLIVRILSVGGSVGEPRHNRVPSNSSEKAEEGTGIQLHRIPPGTKKPYRQVLNPERPVERRAVRVSGRRKRD
ncbi:etoposide-induced protein 2.4-domain-containing protein [Lanmaoa asiatica]|nr:etoposide-induced protein 2.4-domain-containing protein [Lanmaoa asiatica]